MGRLGSNRHTGYVCRVAGAVSAAGLVALMASPAAAINVRLGWSTVQNAAGYKVYTRQIGQAYGGGINVGLIPPAGGIISYVAAGLPLDITNFFAVTSYDALGRESGLSNELSLLVTAPPGATSTRTRTATATRTATGPPPTVPVASATPTRSWTRTPTQPTATRTATRSATRSPTRTATPPPSAGTKLGLTSVGGILDSNDSHYLNGSLVFTSSVGQIVSMSAYVGSIDTYQANRNYQMAIYTNNSGRPVTLVAKTASGTLVANSWNTLPITASLQANASYWLIYNTNGRSGAVNNLHYNGGTYGYGAYSSGTVNFGTWPTTFPTSTLSNAVYSLYATFGP